MATIFDVASVAGVSIKTVSRVLNHESHVRDATRDRVLAAIAELDYQPNPNAQYLGSLSPRPAPASGASRAGPAAD